jgi:hypothetical protein
MLGEALNGALGVDEEVGGEVDEGVDKELGRSRTEAETGTGRGPGGDGDEDRMRTGLIDFLISSR